MHGALANFRFVGQVIHQHRDCNTSWCISGAEFRDIHEECICQLICRFAQRLIALDATNHAETSVASFVRFSEDSEGSFDIFGCEALVSMAALEILLAVQVYFLSQSLDAQRPRQLFRICIRYFHTHQHL